MDILFAYKTMPEWHKDNLINYLIYYGIYSYTPNISDDEAKFLFSICNKIENNNINPFSISHYLTEHYINGDLTKEDLKKFSSSEICEAVYFDDLSYLHLKNVDIEEEK